jgi:RNA polymerase sigma-70 factor (ECF subfamily)
VEAAPQLEEGRRPDASPGTLADVLYGEKSRRIVPEQDWVALVHAVAAGDQVALHGLYERTHRLVFTLMFRMTRSRETAEELTLDVFHDVWRPRAEDPAAASEAPDSRELVELAQQGRRLRQALSVLTEDERKAIEAAFFCELTYAEVAVWLDQPLGTVKTRIRSALQKLRQTLAAGGTSS